MTMKFRITLFLLLLGIVGAAPIFAGSAAIGTVAGSLNATVGGQALLANGAVFSGDQLQVTEGAAVIALANGSRMTLGSETQAQFFKEADGVTLALAKGNVSMFHPAEGSPVAVNAASWSITPVKGYKTVGRVAMLNREVMVTAKEGSLHVTGNGRAIDVAQGKTVTLLSKNAAMPQTGTSQKLVSGNTGLEAAGLGAGVVAAILAGIGMSRAGNARDAANAANTQAAAATSAANAATSAANAANSTANLAGCAVNNFQENVFGSGSRVPSPYTPPSGSKCPKFTP